MEVTNPPDLRGGVIRQDGEYRRFPSLNRGRWGLADGGSARGACELVRHPVEVEVAALSEAYEDHRTESGCRPVVRHVHGPELAMGTGFSGSGRLETAAGRRLHPEVSWWPSRREIWRRRRGLGATADRKQKGELTSGTAGVAPRVTPVRTNHSRGSSPCRAWPRTTGRPPMLATLLQSAGDSRRSRPRIWPGSGRP